MWVRYSSIMHPCRYSCFDKAEYCKRQELPKAVRLKASVFCLIKVVFLTEKCYN